MSNQDKIAELKAQIAKLEKEAQTPKKRGRPKKIVKTAEQVVAPVSDDSKFLINNGAVFGGVENEEKYGRKESLNTIKFKNKFNPKKEVLTQDSFDKVITKNKKPTPRNREKAPQQIEVKCDKCGRKYMALENEVNIMIPGDDEPMSNNCGKCIKSLR